MYWNTSTLEVTKRSLKSSKLPFVALEPTYGGKIVIGNKMWLSSPRKSRHFELHGQQYLSDPHEQDCQGWEENRSPRDIWLDAKRRDQHKHLLACSFSI